MWRRLGLALVLRSAPGLPGLMVAGSLGALAATALSAGAVQAQPAAEGPTAEGAATAATPGEGAPATAGSAAEEKDQPGRRGFVFWIVFWSGAVVVMALVGRVVFREHLHERVTLKMLRDHIGKVYPQFDPTSITKWVYRAAPHVWHGQRQRDMSSLTDFATPEFLAAQATRFAEQRAEGRSHDCRLAAILKVHTLGMYPTENQTPPTGLELVLRVESRGVDCERDPAGKVVKGKPDERQVQHFWTLRHDGGRWRLHHVEPATDDRTDLAERPPVPPLIDWRWPEAATPDLSLEKPTA